MAQVVPLKLVKVIFERAQKLQPKCTERQKTFLAATEAQVIVDTEALIIDTTITMINIGLMKEKDPMGPAVMITVLIEEVTDS